jgi:hypothetical protein
MMDLSMSRFDDYSDLVDTKPKKKKKKLPPMPDWKTIGIKIGVLVLGTAILSGVLQYSLSSVVASLPAPQAEETKPTEKSDKAEKRDSAKPSKAKEPAKK